MPRFAANLSTLYPEFPLLDRIEAAARDGFAAVEVQSPYEASAADWGRALDEAGVPLVLLNSPRGGQAADRGLAALPGREAEFEASIDLALDYARVLGCRRLHVLAGCPPADASPEQCRRTFLRNLAWACAALRPHGITATIEPLNRRDAPGYFLRTLEQAAGICSESAHANLGLQIDLYHLQIEEGDLTHRLEHHLPQAAHLQVAGVPGRNEPDTGEVDCRHLFDLIDRLGYRGWVGCEYRPARGGAGGTSAGLGWMRVI
jgi:hydroxypyruvate isomerase